MQAPEGLDTLELGAHRCTAPGHSVDRADLAHLLSSRRSKSELESASLCDFVRIAGSVGRFGDRANTDRPDAAPGIHGSGRNPAESRVHLLPEPCFLSVLGLAERLVVFAVRDLVARSLLRL